MPEHAGDSQAIEQLLDEPKYAEWLRRPLPQGGSILQVARALDESSLGGVPDWPRLETRIKSSLRPENIAALERYEHVQLAVFRRLAIDLARLPEIPRGADGAVDETPMLWAKAIGRRWIEILIGFPEKTSYFRESRGADESLYAGDLRPKVGKPAGCIADLPRLDKLTMPEAELALAVFSWSSRQPRFAWWLVESPDLLPGIHALLFRTAAFPIMGCFWKALKAAPLARRRAGLPPVSRLYLRIAGLVAVGVSALAGIAPAQAIVLGGGPAVASIGAVIAVLALVGFAWVDVIRRSAGFLVSFRHAWPRVWRLVTRFLGWSGAMTGAFLLLWAMVGWGAMHPTLQAEWRAASFVAKLFLAGHFAMWASVLGLILQWLWTEESVAEPL